MWGGVLYTPLRAPGESLPWHEKRGWEIPPPTHPRTLTLLLLFLAPGLEHPHPDRHTPKVLRPVLTRRLVFKPHLYFFVFSFFFTA